MRTVQWSIGPKQRSRVHGVNAFSLKTTHCGKKIGRDPTFGSAMRPTETEKQLACAKCFC